jgi:chemotaxis signal transduction protein
MNDRIVKLEFYLIFRLDKKVFAVSVQNVLEVMEKQEITEVPNAPEMVNGVINFRGEILPVINTGRKFGNASYELTQKFVIIVLEVTTPKKQYMVGAIADYVIDVIEISDDEIKPVPEMGSSFNPSFLKGMYKADNGFIMLLNANEVFSGFEVTEMSEIK